MLKGVSFVIIRRFAELFGLTAAFSAIITALNVSGLIYTENYTVTVALIFAVAAIIYINVILMRNCYFDLRDAVAHYVANFIAYALFFALTVAMYIFFGSSPIFSWLFSVTKFVHFQPLLLPTWISIAAFHIIGIASVVFAPAGMADMIDYLDEASVFYEDTEENK